MARRAAVCGSKPASLHEAGAFSVGVEFQLARVALIEYLMQHGAGAREAGSDGLEEGGGGQLLAGVAAQDVGHFVAEEEGEFRGVAGAEVDEGLGDEDEAAG